jgi:DNA mismatch repair ATPase MutS
LFSWKNRYSGSLKTWLETIGEAESINSIANFRFNNPGYCFPEINTAFEIGFKNAGHPLIPAEKRICNDVQFHKNYLMILSGSNMSGKSTFLRTIGINMVLSGAGAPVCASAATVHCLPLYTSMRLSDSLTENESYFFAEIKRLQWIRNTLDRQVVFVLLDEILRGTNSDDKQHGTIKIIKKLTEQKAIGVLATHDLEVCAMALEDPLHLFNKCFEVEIIRNNLHFDYQLRDGFCKNRSASFLMEKLGII